MRRIGAVAALAIATAWIAGAGSASSATTSSATAGQGREPAAAEPAAKAPPPVHIVIPQPRQSALAYATGFSDAVKLRGSAILATPAPAVPDEDVTMFVTYELPVAAIDCLPVGNPECSAIDFAAGQLSFHGKPALPPVRETFLAFGFMPVTATLTLTQVGTRNCAAAGQPAFPAPMCIYNDVRATAGAGTVTVATSDVQAGISDLKVNGVPLDVGSGCRSEPFELTLTGSSVGALPGFPQFPPLGEYALNNGGILNGTADIPPFTGCVTTRGEDLAPLLDSSISGPGNYVQITQSALCVPANSFQCPPAAQQPLHGLPEVSITGTGDGTHTTTTCDRVSHKTALDGAPGDTDVGTVESFSVSDCTATPLPGFGGEAASCSMTGHNLPWSITATSYDPNTAIAVGRINSVDLTGQCATGAGGTCAFEQTGTVDVLYDYHSAILADLGSPLTTTASTCTDFPRGVQDNLFIPQYAVPAAAPGH